MPNAGVYSQATCQGFLLLGDMEAQLSVARCYNHGKGVEQSFEKAFKHHMKAAEAGVCACVSWIEYWVKTKVAIATEMSLPVLFFFYSIESIHLNYDNINISNTVKCRLGT